MRFNEIFQEPNIDESSNPGMEPMTLLSGPTLSIQLHCGGNSLGSAHGHLSFLVITFFHPF